MNIFKKFPKEKLIFLYFVLFPFGQLLRFEVPILSTQIRVHPADLVAAVSLIFLVLIKEKPQIFKYINAFLVVAIFSVLYSTALFDSKLILVGIMYLVRLVSYFAFFVMVWDYVKSNQKKRLVFNTLIAVSIATAVFGWFQYFLFPNFRPFVEYGWDDHLYRLVGTFFDPGFTSIIFVFGLLASLALYTKKEKRSTLFIIAILFTTLLFTYARSGYVALLAGLAPLAIMRKKIGAGILFAVFFLLLLPLLPRAESEGVKLERTASINFRLQNYSETVEIIKKSPIFGIGYNNMCLARQEYLNKGVFESHSCAGSDSSMLLVVATTGIVGFITFLALLFKMGFSVDPKDIYGQIFIASGIALLAHSIFTNSLFYPWVMGYILSLFAVAIKPRG